MTQAFTGYVWISFAATPIKQNKIVQESIFEKLQQKNLTSFVVNGGAIYGTLFLNYTNRTETDGGNILDLTTSDTLGFEALFDQIKENEFDSYFIHLVGIDHAGHSGGMTN